MKRIIIRILSRIGRYIAPSYIAGENLVDGLRVCRKYHRAGWGTTICPWDDERESYAEITRRYIDALSAVQAEGFDSYLSIKAPSFGYQLQYLLEIIEAARSKGTRIHFDSMYPHSVQPTFELLREAVKVYPNMGCTLPARWDRSLHDIDQVIEAECSVRIVKGQWRDPWNPHIDIEARYLEIVRALAGKVPMVSIASHDPKLVEASLSILAESDTPCELELLYGLPMGVSRIAAEKDVSTRVYVPYGIAYLPYALSDLKRRPRILMWILKDAIVRTFGLKE